MLFFLRPLFAIYENKFCLFLRIFKALFLRIFFMPVGYHARNILSFHFLVIAHFCFQYSLVFG